MAAKKKATKDRMSLLEYMIHTKENKDKPPSSSRERARLRTPTTKNGESESGTEWTKEEVSALKGAIKETSSVEDKNARWKQIAGLVGNGKTRKHCYLKYKILKQEQADAAAKKASPRRKRNGSKNGPGEAKLSIKKTSDTPAKVNENGEPDNENSTEDDSPSKEASEKSEPVATFAVSRRTAQPSTKTSSEALEMEDCEDMGALLEQPTAKRAQASRTNSNLGSSFVSVTTRILTASDVAAVQQLLFGTGKKAFSSHWEEQGFVFSTARDLQYGLIQHQGGPCGILAVVQGYVLRFLLQHAPVDWKNPGVPQQERALVQALAHILWQAAQASRVTECVVAVKDNHGGGQRRFMSGLKLHVATSEEQARQIITAHLSKFMEPKGSGLVQFVFSVLLTKGAETIKDEMDQLARDSGGQLIGAHDYCTQEIVNLLLCGYARSNVFNGTQVLEGTSASDPDAIVLHGISSQSVIGFLSLFEAYQNLIVGSYLKQPRVNIWVVCSESHYSVLFAADPRALEDRELETRSNIDLLYYDGLANQDEEIHLTVDTLTLEPSATVSHDDLIPPLNLVIRTKWPRATVDWNGVEPLL
ncbi:Hypothetical protein PHPALM_13108 [Phytophthora palmivora]|uniref:Myb-like domain-containing protein n=1 Tax=Phytophthora palmivora TaxID=4796 RepID=A0A2P4XY14_9STRA|nr:Hypothetical protein PHPALM_13108 [Phytophthora palmivora]